MTDLIFSKHASTRCAQRAINKALIDIVLDYGREDYDHRGACRYFLGNPEKRQLLKDSPELFKKLGRKLDAVVVMTSKGPPLVVTTFVRNRRHRQIKSYHWA